jgi:hypothetical protein
MNGIIGDRATEQADMTVPFRVSEHAAGLTAAMPTAIELLDLLQLATEAELRAFARQWLTEGVPATFINCPMVWEDLRVHVGSTLNVHPKHVSTTGSARTGYSMTAEFGRPFGGGSDLDMFIVDSDLFDRLRLTFASWADDIANARVVARNANERRHWESNQNEVPRALRRGFIDHWSIPNRDRYPDVRRCYVAAYSAKRRLHVTEGAPRPVWISFRVYQTWKFAISQICCSLSYTRSSHPVLHAGLE